MGMRNPIMMTTLFAALALPTAAQAATPCVLEGHTITDVTPYRTLDRNGKAVSYRLRGAVVHLRGEAGLTTDSFRGQVEQHLAAMGTASMPGCPFSLRDVTVRVSPDGQGYQVSIVARDTATAYKVLHRARLL